MPNRTPWMLVIAGLAACGSVSAEAPDAPTADAAQDAAVPDALAPDTPIPPPPPTAISLGSVTAFSVAPDAFGKIPFTDELYDDNDEYDVATNRFTPIASGDYLLCASLFGFGAVMELELFVDETSRVGLAYSRLGIAEGCRAVRLQAGQHLDVRVHHENSAAFSFVPVPEWSWLTIHRVDSIFGGTTAASLAAPNTTFVHVPYATEAFDTTNAYDAATGVFTAPAAGDYQLCSSLSFGGPVLAELDVFVDGVREGGSSFGSNAAGGCRTVRLGAGARVAVNTWHNAGTAQTFLHDPRWSGLQIQRLAATVSIKGMATFVAPRLQLVKVPFAGEVFDDANQYDASTHTFTAASAGDYLVCASFHNRSTAFTVELDLYKNGVRERGFAHGFVAVGGCRIVRLVASDRLEVYMMHGAADALSFEDDGQWFWLQVSKLP